MNCSLSVLLLTDRSDIQCGFPMLCFKVQVASSSVDTVERDRLGLELFRLGFSGGFTRLFGVDSYLFAIGWQDDS